MANDYDASLKDDFEWSVGLNRNILRFMGAWPEDKSAKQKFFDNLKMPLMVLCMFCFLFLPQMYALALVKNNFLLVIDNLMTSCPTFLSCLKLTVFWYNRHKLKPVINCISNDWSRPKQKWERKIMRDKAFIGRLFTIFVYVCIASTGLGFVVAPIYGLSGRVITNITDHGPYPLIVQSYYPFDFIKRPIFELIHISQTVSAFIVILSSSFSDSYFGILVFHLSAQFEILGARLEQLFQKVNGKLFHRRLKICVNRHVYLINLVTMVENSFHFIVFNQILCLSLTTCCLGFRILYSIQTPTDAIPPIQICNFLFAVMYLMLFTLNDCTASETLTYQSSRLLYSIYKSSWYAFPGSRTRELIILMCIAKKPQTLSACKIMNLSLFTFCSVLKSVAGYLSVLFACGR